MASNWTLGLQSGSSAESQGAGAPSAPTGVASACAAAKTVTVTWNSVTQAGSYTVYQSSKSASSGYEVAGSNVTGSSWTSEKLDRKTSYWFEVVAVAGSSWTSASSSYTGPRVFAANGDCT